MRKSYGSGLGFMSLRVGVTRVTVYHSLHNSNANEVNLTTFRTIKTLYLGYLCFGTCHVSIAENQQKPPTQSSPPPSPAPESAHVITGYDSSKHILHTAFAFRRFFIPMM